MEVEGDTQGYIPARPLNRIYLDQLINAFEGKLEVLASIPAKNSEALRILSYQLKYSRQKVINGISIQSLLSDSKEVKPELIDEFQPQLEDKRFKEVE